MYHLSLGLFLAQYLCNGFNLADAGELTYDSLFFSSDHQQFEFLRKKTAGRSNKPAWVVIPIIEALQKVLDEIAAPIARNARVFPYILQDAKTKKEIRRRISQENKNIKSRVQKIAKEVLGWDDPLCSTYARHSFATNLRDSGVDVQYISDAMGHATDKTTTQLYFARFPKSTQFANNEHLLDLKKKTTIAVVRSECVDKWISYPHFHHVMEELEGKKYDMDRVSRMYNYMFYYSEDFEKSELPKWCNGRMIIRNWQKSFEKCSKPS